MKSIDLSALNEPGVTVTGPVSLRSSFVDQSSNPSSNPSAAALSTGLSSTSFTSFIPSPRLSFQTLTSFIASPWSQRKDANEGPANSSMSANKHDQATSAHFSAPKKNTFVRKETQLEKLRLRLEREDSLKMNASTHVACKQCDDKLVTL